MQLFLIGLGVGLVAGGALVWVFKSKAAATVKDAGQALKDAADKVAGS